MGFGMPPFCLVSPRVLGGTGILPVFFLKGACTLPFPGACSSKTFLPVAGGAGCKLVADDGFAWGRCLIDRLCKGKHWQDASGTTRFERGLHRVDSDKLGFLLLFGCRWLPWDLV
jgi:hypothetical protein